ncbi:RNA 3'-terminal phosphate cyclase domain-containing protein, partial [Aspergillus floccosus]
LKGSHIAAIKFLADLIGATVSGLELGSSTLTFSPPSLQDRSTAVRSHIHIEQSTAGSVFLVFQALYPYLLHAGTTSATPHPITLTITGGTNVSFSPSFDYVAQVLVPNLACIGLPPLEVCLDRRGWATGPVNLGKVTIRVDPLRRRQDSDDSPISALPSIDLGKHQRGSVTQIDITVLAPDDPVLGRTGNRKAGRGGRHRQFSNQDWEFDRPGETTATIRDCVEKEVLVGLQKGLQTLPPWALHAHESPLAADDGEKSNSVPVRIHTSEGTRHFSHLYVLIVAHTSTGFRIGHDALYGGAKGERRRRETGGQDRHASRGTVVAARELAKDCVAGFFRELYDARLQGSTLDGAGHQPCVDEYMRDQVVVFEALGRRSGKEQICGEDERYWSLHTRTAQWVCEAILCNSKKEK